MDHESGYVRQAYDQLSNPIGHSINNDFVEYRSGDHLPHTLRVLGDSFAANLATVLEVLSGAIPPSVEAVSRGRYGLAENGSFSRQMRSWTDADCACCAT